MSDKNKQTSGRALLSLIRRLQIRWYIMLHRSRREPYFLYDEHKPRRKRSRGLSPRIYSFTGALAALTVLSLLYPLRPSYSAMEHRDLAAFPAFSLSAVADGSYFSGLSTWFADTFPLRDRFLALNDEVNRLRGFQGQTVTGQAEQADEIPDAPDADVESPAQETPAETAPAQDTPPAQEPAQEVESPETNAPAQPETPAESEASSETAEPVETEAPTEPEAASQPEETTQAEETVPEEEEDLEIPELDADAVVEKLSAVLSIDNAAYEYYNFILDRADRYTAAVSSAAEQLEGDANVYNIIVPNSMGICVPLDVQEQVNTSDQKKAIDYMYGNYDDNVHAVPVYNTLLKHSLEGEYLYFRTDHHWTALGAYRAYEQYCAAAGITPTPLDFYEEHEYEGFLGTFYGATKSKAMAATPDTVYAYESPSTNTLHIKTKERSDWEYVVIGNMTNSSSGLKYGTFIGGDNPFSYVENPEKDDDSAVMLIKESYGNAFAPFLIDNYQYTYIVDYRYVNQVDKRHLAEMCRDLGVQDVIFLNTISTTRASSLISKLESFVG